MFSNLFVHMVIIRKLVLQRYIGFAGGQLQFSLFVNTVALWPRWCPLYKVNIHRRCYCRTVCPRSLDLFHLLTIQNGLRRIGHSIFVVPQQIIGLKFAYRQLNDSCRSGNYFVPGFGSFDPDPYMEKGKIWIGSEYPDSKYL